MCNGENSKQGSHRTDDNWTNVKSKMLSVLRREMSASSEIQVSEL